MAQRIDDVADGAPPGYADGPGVAQQRQEDAYAVGIDPAILASVQQRNPVQPLPVPAEAPPQLIAKCDGGIELRLRLLPNVGIDNVETRQAQPTALFRKDL